MKRDAPAKFQFPRFIKNSDVEIVERENLFQNTRTQGHPQKLKDRRFRTDKVFLHIVHNLWNSLPQHVVMNVNLEGGVGKLMEEWAING